MNKQVISFLITVLCITFFGCDMMATLFHGEKPEPPPVAYTVTFNANGASGTPPEARTVNDGAVINLPDRGSMSSTGNIFAGWNESSSGGGTTYSIGASITVTRNMVFYAQWLDGSTPQFTVTFNANSATSGTAPAPQTAYSGISITIPGQGTLAYSGKTFGGWNTQANGGGTNYAVGADFTVTGHITLYAKWQSEIQYTVTYHANGASGTAPSAQTVDPGTVVTLPGAGSMTNLGKTFEGWNTNAGGTGTDYAEGAAYTVNAHATLYAKWLSVPIEPPGATLVEKLAYIAGRADDGIVYDITVNSTEYLQPANISTMGRNVTVNIHSDSSNDIKTIYLASATGHLFTVNNEITLKTMNIVMQGSTTNNVALVKVATGGVWDIYSGTKITGNYNSKFTDDTGGGILVNGGMVTMFDGEISGNRATGYWGCGGGLLIWNVGNFIMHGGLIKDNQARHFGGGVAINGNNSQFTKAPKNPGETSGVIYGSSAGTGLQNTAENGAAVFKNISPNKARNSTLGGFDVISTSNMIVGWE
jgi:uncharacterized repeat protein (TIGR02543 family)